MFKNWITHMSAFEMTFLIIGIATPIVFMVAIFFTFRGSSLGMRAAKVFLTREKWPGKIYNTRIVSWQQTNMFYGNDLFIDISFHLDNPQQLHSAKALIAPAQLHLLRKALPIVVKKGKKNNIAVLQLGAWDAGQTSK
ncbi:hypothetical protein [Kosakonia sp. SMBL-WEM22]|uniref:hypothetical protein n=1 Tax=Kosakonia sp. SMBL-WEM22 TaxID=2725560 RepID=UPI001CB8D69C|nr:hypothetical protein [Kosakonia sp. SMBL-WEM22]